MVLIVKTGDFSKMLHLYFYHFQTQSAFLKICDAFCQLLSIFFIGKGICNIMDTWQYIENKILDLFGEWCDVWYAVHPDQFTDIYELLTFYLYGEPPYKESLLLEEKTEYVTELLERSSDCLV